MKALFLLCLLSKVVFSLKVLTNQNIDDAVEDWIDNPDDAVAMYGNITKWNTTEVTSMSTLFEERATFNDAISGWDVSSVSSMKDMFHGASSFNQNISGWDVSSVSDATNTFFLAIAFKQDLCAWGSKLQKSGKLLYYMFYLAHSCPETAPYTPSLTGTFPGPFCYSCEFFTFTDSNIRQAVEDWIDNPDDALTIYYGDIATWDTLVTSQTWIDCSTTGPNSTITSLGGTSIRSPA